MRDAPSPARREVRHERPFQNLPRAFSGNYLLRARCDGQVRIDAVAAASDKFYGLCLADRADAIILDGSLEYFEVEEGGAL